MIFETILDLKQRDFYETENLYTNHKTNVESM